jgi:hypothetical protein
MYLCIAVEVVVCRELCVCVCVPWFVGCVGRRCRLCEAAKSISLWDKSRRPGGLLCGSPPREGLHVVHLGNLRCA